MKIHRHTILMTAVLSGVAMSSLAQTVPARVLTRNAKSAVEVVLTGRNNGTLHAKLATAEAGAINIEAADVESVRFELDGGKIGMAENAVRANKVSDAVRYYREAVAPALSYLDLPLNNAIQPAFRYAELLRLRGMWGESIKVYRALQSAPDAAVRNEALAWDAYALTRQREFETAKGIVDNLKLDDPRERGFTAASIAQARIALSRNQDENALDWSSRAAALSRLENGLYPEALMLTAECYERLGRKAPVALRDSAVVRDDGSAPRELPLTAEQFAGVVESVYSQITNLFPSAEQAAIAADRLAAATNQTVHPVLRGSVSGE